MVLPASQYSVLDAKRIERLDEDTFRCYVGGLKLFSLEVEPVITVSVTVQERGPTVRLLSTKVRPGHSRRFGTRCWQGCVRVRLCAWSWAASCSECCRRGTRSVRTPRRTMPLLQLPPPHAALPQLKGSKAVEAANERFDATMTNVVRWQEAPGGGKQLASDTFIQVQLQVPAWFVLPTSTIERTGAAGRRAGRGEGLARLARGAGQLLSHRLLLRTPRTERFWLFRAVRSQPA